MIDYTPLENRILDLVRQSSITITMGALQNQRIVLGGIRGSGGGSGGPIVPFVGQLKQTSVTFDDSELATITMPASGISLLDNLNRIRSGWTIIPTGVAPQNYTPPASGTLIDHFKGVDTALGLLTSWKLENTLVVSDSGFGDYTTLAAAIAVATYGDVILLDQGSYASSNQLLPSGVALISIARGATNSTLIGTSPVLRLSGLNYLSGLRLLCTSFGGTALAVQNSPNNAAEGCSFQGGSTGNCVAIYGTNSSITFAGCQIGVGAGTALSITGTGATTKVYGGYLYGLTNAISQNSGNTLFLSNLPKLDAALNNSGTVEGWYEDKDGNLTCPATATMHVKENTSHPSTAATDSWRLYFTPSGLFTIDDANIKKGPYGSTLFTQTASVTVSNSASELTLVGAGAGSVTLPANFFKVGKSIRGFMRGYNSTTAAAGTMTFRVKLGSTTILATAANTATNNLSNRGFDLQFIITCRSIGGSGTVMAQGTVLRSTGAATSVRWEMVNTSTVSIDTTTAQTLDITVQWGTAASGNTITSTNLFVSELS